MAFKKAIRLFSILVLISVFIYWAIGAYMKYELEPISTSTEYRLGDDDLGNFSLPVFTFFFIEKFRIPKCKKIHRDKMWTEGMTAASISCMQDYDNVTAFLEDVHVQNPMRRKKNCMQRFPKIIRFVQIFAVQAHPWTKNGAGFNTMLNNTMNSMWKVVHHQELGEGYQFNPYDQGMPNITMGKDVRRISFKPINPKQRRFMMVVHNQFDFQDALVLYSFETLMEKGEIKYRKVGIRSRGF